MSMLDGKRLTCREWGGKIGPGLSLADKDGFTDYVIEKLGLVQIMLPRDPGARKLARALKGCPDGIAYTVGEHEVVQDALARHAISRRESVIRVLETWRREFQARKNAPTQL